MKLQTKPAFQRAGVGRKATSTIAQGPLAMLDRSAVTPVLGGRRKISFLLCILRSYQIMSASKSPLVLEN